MDPKKETTVCKFFYRIYILTRKRNWQRLYIYIVVLLYRIYKRNHNHKITAQGFQKYV